MKARRISVLGLLLLLSSSGQAVAQEAAGDPALATGFATLDRVGGQSNAGIAAGISLFDDSLADFGIRFDLYGQYVAPEGWGVYGQLPVSFISGEGDSETAVGGLGVGGTFTVPGSIPVVLRGGVILPTGSDSLEGRLTNLYTSFGRLADFAAVFPETTWLRLSGSPVFYSGQVFARVDGGVELPVQSSDGTDPDPLARLDLGVGFEADAALLTAELASVGTLGDVGPNEDRFLHTFAVSARAAGKVQPYGAIVLPLNSEVRDDVHVILTVGVQGNFPQGM